MQSEWFNLSVAAKTTIRLRFEILEETPLMLLFINGDLRVYVICVIARDGTAIDGFEPFVAIVLLPEPVVLTLE